MTNPPRLVNQAEAAAIFGVTPRTVIAWGAAGCPVVSRGGVGLPTLYSPAAVLAWREGRAAAKARAGDADLDEARRRKAVAEACLAEIDLAMVRGEAVEIDAVMEDVGHALDACRAKLLALGSRLAPFVAIETDLDRVRALLDEGVAEAVAELQLPAIAAGEGGEAIA